MSIRANCAPADGGKGIKVLHEAHHRVVTLFDTAEVHGPYASEALVGEAMNRAVDGAAGDRPVIADYCQRLSARPAYRRAIAKGGPTLRPPPAAQAATDFQPVQGEHE